MKLLMMCTGNMNRSAAAHYLAQRKLQGSSHQVDSAGTSKKAVNKPMAKKTREALKQWGFNFGVKDHRSKPLDRALVDWADKIIYMVPGHYKDIVAEFPDAKDKLVSMASFSRGKYDHIDDPAWTKGVEIAITIIKQIDECLDNMIVDWSLL
jgi:protein-tyrosine phosphatase